MTRDVRSISYSLLLGIAFYLPLEDYVLRWIPLPEGPLTVLRQIPEVLIWLIALAVSALHVTRHGTIRVLGRRIDFFLLGFVAVAFASMFLNGANVFLASISLKALLRYIPVVYILIMLEPSEQQLARLPRVVLAAFGIQVAIGTLEWIVGQPAREFFSVVHAWGGYSFIGVPLEGLLRFERQDVSGTFGRPVVFAYFMLVGLVVWMVRFEERPRLYVLGIVITLLMTFHAHSRMAVFSAVVLVAMHQIMVRGFRKTLALSLFAVPFAGVFVLTLGSSFAENLYFLDVFTEEYQQHALTQRLGLIVYLLPNAFNGGITLLGHSTDTEIVAAAVSQHFHLSRVLSYVFVDVVEDVYWVAMLLYYGFVGLGLFALFYGKLTALIFQLYRKVTDSPARTYVLIALMLLLINIFLNAVNQTFEMRQFSFYMWMFTGVAVAVSRNALDEPSGLSVEQA